MLSSKRVRQHGMIDNRWKVKDKLTQYKGLIKLYERDKKIFEYDTLTEKKKLDKKLDDLQKMIRKDRETLSNVMVGDREMLRNTLAPNRPLQLSRQNSHPLQVIEYLEQENFIKRKQLDKIRCEVNVKKDKLVQLQLEVRAHQEKVVFEKVEPNELRAKCRVLAGQVEEAVLKQRAAIDIQKTYQSIIQLMKKDALFFNVIIESVKEDFENQAYLLIRTTEMGQLATEYKDDREYEFKTLERQVKRDLRSREITLETTQNNVKTAHKKLKGLVNVEEDVKVGNIPIKKNLSEVILKIQIVRLEKVLQYLKKHLGVNNYKSIFPCLVSQQNQHNRLQELVAMNEIKLDMLLNKKNHAEILCSTLTDTMQDKTEEYKDNKFILHNKIEEQKKLRMEHNTKIGDCTNMMMDIKMALYGLQQTCKPIKIPGEIEPILFDKSKPPEEHDVEESIKLVLRSLNCKLDKLMTEDIMTMDDHSRKRAFVDYQNHLSTAFSKTRTNKMSLTHEIDYPTLEYDVVTRAQIKQASKNLVDLYTNSLLDLPRPDTSKKSQCVPDEFFENANQDDYT